jgi:hypothetical protein
MAPKLIEAIDQARAFIEAMISSNRVETKSKRENRRAQLPLWRQAPQAAPAMHLLLQAVVGIVHFLAEKAILKGQFVPRTLFLPASRNLR